MQGQCRRANEIVRSISSCQSCNAAICIAQYLFLQGNRGQFPRFLISTPAPRYRLQREPSHPNSSSVAIRGLFGVESDRSTSAARDSESVSGASIRRVRFGQIETRNAHPGKARMRQWFILCCHSRKRCTYDTSYLSLQHHPSPGIGSYPP